MALGWRGQYYKYKQFSLNLLAQYKQRSDLQAFLEIILSLTTLIIFSLFAIKPTILTMISLNKEIKTKQETLDGLNQKISDLQTANNVYRQNENLIPFIDAVISDTPQPDLASQQILGLAQKNSVTVLGISFGQAQILGQAQSVAQASPSKETKELKDLPNGAQALPLIINVRGDYPNLVSFLTDLESSRVPVKIDTLTIGATNIGSENTITELVNSRIPYLK